MANHISSDPNYQPQGGVSEQASQMLNDFWPKVMQTIQELTTNDFKNQDLPLARIKKIMKLDEDVKMISAEAPVLFAKAAEIFIREMSIRAWLHTEDNKRRTLQRNDIAMAISKFDQFDFLIDIVPRDELKPAKRQEETTSRPTLPDQLQYFLQMAAQQQPGAQQQQQTQQQSQQQQQQVVAQPAAQQVQQVQQVAQQVPVSSQQAAVTVQTSQPQQATAIQLPGGQVIQQPFQIQVAQSAAGTTTLQTLPLQTVQAQLKEEQAGGQSQLIQIQAPQQVQVAQPQPVVSGTTQVYQQVVTPNGEVQNIPIQLTPAQLQAIQMQLQGKQQGQIVIQTSQAQPVQQVQAISQADHQAFAQGLYRMQMGQGAQQIFIQQAAAGDDQQVDGQDGS